MDKHLESLKWDREEQVDSLLKDLDNLCEKITALELSSYSIGPKVAVALSDKISKIKNLQFANFSDIFKSRGKDEIPDALKSIMEAILDKRIRILNLHSNAIGLLAVKSLDFFLRDTKHLMELNIGNNGMSDESAEILAQALIDNPNKVNLEVLIVERNKIQNKGAKAFAKY